MHPAERKLSQPGSLAERLYRMRKAAGLTGDQLAAELGWGKATGRTKVSKIENGKQLPSAGDVHDWAAATRHPEAAGELADMLADVEAVHRGWRGQLRHGQAAVQQDYDRRVRAASRFRASSPVTIPGLLQTAGYARALMTQVAELWDTGDIDAAVEARIQRQQVLYDPSKTFEFAVAEPALRMLPCLPQVMLGQLDRLLTLDLDNVTLGIVPMGVQLDMLPFTSFMLADDRAVVESHGGEDALGERESADYARVFGRLMAEAATGEEARRLIAEAAAALR